MKSCPVILRCLILLVVAVLAACQPIGSTPAAAFGPPVTQASATPASPCGLPTVQAPPQPEVTPALYQQDPATGLHVTGVLHDIDPAAYRLKVTGAVTQELSLSYEELRCLPKVATKETLDCPGFFTDVATWGGVPLSEILKLAGVKSGATEIRLIADDGYTAQITMEEALQDGYYLAYELEGQTLPQLHGFPLRAVLRGQPGFKWVKWLVEVQVH